MISLDYGVLAVAPDYVGTACGFCLPRHIRERFFAYDFYFHYKLSPFIWLRADSVVRPYIYSFIAARKSQQENGHLGKVCVLYTYFTYTYINIAQIFLLF